jgi:hypothetical protein
VEQKIKGDGPSTKLVSGQRTDRWEEHFQSPVKDDSRPHPAQLFVIQNNHPSQKEITMTSAPKYLDSIECSDQPLDISFHPNQAHLVAAALVDGTVEGETETDDETVDETTKHILLFFLPVSFV